MQLKDLPALGAPLNGGIFVGVITQPDGTHSAITLLPDRAEDLTWQAAMDWAASAGGHLPTRQEQALLYANCKPHLKPVWHWSCESHEEDAYAWYCTFCNGNQSCHHKRYGGSAVAVRLIHLTA